MVALVRLINDAVVVTFVGERKVGESPLEVERRVHTRAKHLVTGHRIRRTMLNWSCVYNKRRSWKYWRKTKKQWR